MVYSVWEKRTLLTVLQVSRPKARARILSASTTGAGAFLTAIPTRGDLEMNRCDMLVAIRHRLGMPLPAAVGLIGATCSCGMRLDEGDVDGCHLMNCKFVGACGWSKRSRWVQHKVLQIAKAAGLTAALEQVVGSERERTDVTMQDWICRDDNGVALTYHDGSFRTTEMHVDVAVSDATAPSNYAASSKRRGSTARARGARKITKYQQTVNDMGGEFLPAVVEAHGLLDHGFVKLLSHIAECHIDLSQQGADLAKTDRSVIKSQLMNTSYQLISVALQKGVAGNIRAAARRAMMMHTRRTDAGARQTGGLSACRLQNMLGANERALAFGSQVVA
jgi:hypothetical protein